MVQNLKLNGMNKNKEENPLAFPCLDNNDHVGQIKMQSEKMTLRDYFAAKAMQGVLSAHANGGASNPVLMSETSIQEQSKYCYKLADAMLKERIKE